MTADEAAAEKEKAGGFKKKKKRRKKLREKALDPSELEGDELAPGASELGKRRGAESVAAGLAEARDADRAAKDAKFAAALNKAKLKTDEKILAEMAGEAGPGVEDDEGDEDDELGARSSGAAASRPRAPRAPTPPRTRSRRPSPRAARGTGPRPGPRLVWMSASRSPTRRVSRRRPATTAARASSSATRASSRERRRRRRGRRPSARGTSGR